MMLKVGDKVKIRGDLEVGKKFGEYDFVQEMKKYREKLAKIEFVCDRFVLLDIDNQEFAWTKDMLEKIEVKNNMKKLTFKEVVVNIKEGEIWESNTLYIKKEKDSIDIWNNKPSKIVKSILDDTLFTLQRKQYSFEEALKALEERKQIENMERQKYHLDTEGNVIYTFDVANEEIRKIFDVEDIIFSLEEIRGKWYIND
ncbi:hypothetical protein MCG45_16450 [Clostridium perfringens]|uniref:hypothetical protein n=1 Tax=Clostridium perfringens TaxID=1502 RepID=UPI001F065A50|nr:hypothetical protein [Clostridium perfringens]MCH1964422.1 hypothetical protein [Clostridium perfringens]